MKRDIIRIDEAKCNGCGRCVPACHEGAIRIVDGKARLVADALCDGLGACLGECPQGAITIETREARSFQPPMACGCPGSMTQDFRHGAKVLTPMPVADGAGSALRQWPVQLKLLNPQASFFQDADILVSADCAAFACGGFHRTFIQDKVLAIFCPKLDGSQEEYIEKLAAIFRLNHVRSVTAVRMEVPCCGGVVDIVRQALRRCGKDIAMKECTLTRQGDII